MEDDHKAEGDEEEAEVEEDHEATDTLGVGAARVRCCHGLHHQFPTSSSLGLHLDLVTPTATRSVRVLAVI